MKIRLYSLVILPTLFSGALLALQSAGYSINTVAGGHVLGDNGPATAALLLSPEKIITDASGVMYIADTGWHRIRKIDVSGTIKTIAGTGVAGFSGDGLAATEAQLKSPIGLALDAQGSLYVADYGNNRIRRITPAGIISTVAGETSATRLSGPRGLAFDASGNLYVTDSTSGGRLARLTPKGEWQVVVGGGFSNPGGIAVETSGNILVADTGSHTVYRVTPTGEGTVVAGTGYAGFSGDRGPADSTAVRLYYPADVALDRLGAIYIADSGNGRIRKVMYQGSGEKPFIFTEAGGGQTPPFGGEYTTEDPFLSALSSPRGVWVDAAGAVYIADWGYNLVRKLEGGTLKIVAGASRSRGDGGPATSASLYYPRSVAIVTDGNLLIADTGNHKIRKFSPGGAITTLAGTGLAGDAGDGGRAETARLNAPSGLAVDSAGNVYIGDTGNARLRKVRPSFGNDIVTIAGGNGAGGEGDGAGPTSAQVRDINGIALDAEGNIYLADSGNNRIRKIMKDGSTIERFAGTAGAGAGAEGIPAVLSAVNSPYGVVAKDGSIYFSDTNNHRVRRVLPNLTVETVAGTGAPGFSGDGAAARNARLNRPRGLAMDAEGNLYIADTDNHRIRHVNSGGLIRTIAGTEVAGFSGDGGAAVSAQLWSPTGVAVDSKGNIYVADQNNHRIRRLSADISDRQLAIAGGNNQSASTGAKLPLPLAVRLTNRVGAPVAGVSVGFIITRGLAQLSAGSAVTNTDGVASVTITLGPVPGDVLVVASVPGLLSVQFQLTTLGAVVTGQPRILSGGVVGAGLSVPKVRQLSPNGLYTIFGENFAQPGGGWQVGPADLVNGQLPTRFQGVCVRVGVTPSAPSSGTLAPLIHVYPGQVSFQAPNLSASPSVGVQVILNCGEGEVRSNIENVEMRVASPEFLFFVQNADGRNPVAAVNAVTGVYVGPSGLIAGGNFVPAKPGDYVTIFGSGFGATNPLFFAGDLADRSAPVTALVSVTLGGQAVAASDILYTGATPGFAGLYQVNIRIPDNAADGNLPLGISVSGIPSPDGAYLTVKR